MKVLKILVMEQSFSPTDLALLAPYVAIICDKEVIIT